MLKLRQEDTCKQSVSGTKKYIKRNIQTVLQHTSMQFNEMEFTLSHYGMYIQTVRKFYWSL